MSKKGYRSVQYVTDRIAHGFRMVFDRCGGDFGLEHHYYEKNSEGLIEFEVGEIMSGITVTKMGDLYQIVQIADYREGNYFFFYGGSPKTIECDGSHFVVDENEERLGKLLRLREPIKFERSKTGRINDPGIRLVAKMFLSDLGEILSK